MSAMLVRFSETASNPLRPGLMVGTEIADISADYPSICAFLTVHPNGWPADLALPKAAARYSRSAVRLGPPIDPGNTVYAVGANYRKHAEEAGLSVPKQPVIFSKPYTALVGPGEAISIPPVSSQLDYEGEMAVVIGRDATRVTAADAPRHIAGVTVLNDTTARDLQWVELGKNRIVDWFASKCLDRTSPLGPGIASVKAVPDVHRLHLETQLNGETMQDADTSLMMFDTWQLIAFASAHATLRAGDVLATGTPFGVGGFRNIFLKSGDVVRIELESVGVLENAVA
jgi:acylpyruvate hydrolase